MLTTDLRDEASRLLSELIAIDTTNPPGNETVAAKHLAAYLARSGVEAELVGRVPERANLIARIPGRGDGPSLLLLSHTDVVLADPAEWSVPPFSGLDRDGSIWGRGALDMKGQVAAEAVAFAALAREGWQGNGDLILCSVADEEMGNGFGAMWLAEQHPDLIRCDYVVNEGGGERLEHRGRIAYTVNVGEKMCSGFAITVHGRSGHASIPDLADNPVPKLAPVIERIDRMARPTRDLPELRAFLSAIGEDGADPVELARRARHDGSPVVAELIPPMLGAVITPTGLQASPSLNVIPGRARLL
jgi:acetylornithine deacetylase/succinyl-diaminopimelate desuccinylase-like protein